MANLQALERHLLGLGRVLLGYSGGVDSAFLAVVGVRALGPERFVAVIGRSASYPAAQWQAALEIATRFGVPLHELDTHELDDPRYLRNAPDRCYFCKRELWSRLSEYGVQHGYNSIIDGTNADDLTDHRPGMRAGRELAIRSPLAELGWSKTDVRAASRGLGLPTWDAPAAPCLSSRVLYGLEVTPERLRQVEQGEAYLRSLGVAGDLRVRHHGSLARIEVAQAEMARVRAHWPSVEARFGALGFEAVELDPEGYRRGRLLSLAASPE